ncbi:ComF family protein [Candidatus Saccharibacteria bacterium]|nr:ComF family protein [Candidatus Saccharibacteria bacterium]
MNFIVKNTTILNPLDLIAPHSCRGCGRLGTVLCDCCKNNIIKQRSTPNLKNLSKKFPSVYAIDQRSGLLDTLIHDFKYNSTRALATKLAELLNASLPDFPPNSIVVPLPTVSQHIRARGLDHTLLLAKHLAKIRHLKVQKILIRNKNTVQVGANRKTRLAQAKSAYFISNKTGVNPNITYILLDDVWTTGASMKAAVKKLQQAGVSKIVVVLLAISSLDQ